MSITIYNMLINIWLFNILQVSKVYSKIASHSDQLWHSKYANVHFFSRNTCHVFVNQVSKMEMFARLHTFNVIVGDCAITHEHLQYIIIMLIIIWFIYLFNILHVSKVYSKIVSHCDQLWHSKHANVHFFDPDEIF